jgi:quercetin dioxygenase-like cupin family protein
LSGVIEFEIEGKRKRLQSGDSGVIPGNVTHEAWVIEDVEMANIFSPVRDDYLTKGALAYMRK